MLIIPKFLYIYFFSILLFNLGFIYFGFLFATLEVIKMLYRYFCPFSTLTGQEMIKNCLQIYWSTVEIVVYSCVQLFTRTQAL